MKSRITTRRLQYRSSPQRFGKGLTLVEMLVVITIVVAVAVLSLIGVTKVRSSARGATCISNLRQIGAAMLGYAADHGGQLPPLEDRMGSSDSLLGIWPQIIANAGYLPMTNGKSGQLGTSVGVWSCPDCVTTSRYHAGYGGAEGTVMQVQKASIPNSGSLRLAKIPDPERTWLIGDTSNSSLDLKTSWYAIWANRAKWTGSHVPAQRHAGKVNVCMVDGHVESLTRKELEAPDKNYTMYK